MSKSDKNIDDLIRDGFSSQQGDFDFGSWDKVNASLNQSGKKSIDDLLKDAYVVNPDDAVVQEGWGTVNDQLDIDTVWHRLNQKLDNRKLYFYFWRATAVAGLLLLFTYFMADFSMRSEPIAKIEGHENVSNYGLQGSNDSAVGEADIANQEVNISKEDDLLQLQNGVSADQAMHLPSNGANESDVTVSDKGINETVIATTNQHPSTIENANLNTDQGSDDFTVQTDINLLAVQKINPFIHNLGPYDELIEIQKPVEKKRSAWEFGVGIATQQMIVDDSYTSEALSANSTSQLGFKLYPVLFIQGRYKTAKNYFVNIELAPQYTAIHSLLKYENLIRTTRTTELQMTAASVGVGKMFSLSQLSDSHQFLINVTADVNYIWRGDLYRNGVLVDNQLNFKPWDFGAGLNLAYRKNLGRFYLQPSWKTHFGTTNHLQINGSNMGDFNTKRIFTNELSLEFGIKF